MRTTYETKACADKGEGDLFRAWPDGTVQMVDDGAPHSWMSDDYVLVLAASHEDASTYVNGKYPRRAQSPAQPADRP